MPHELLMIKLAGYGISGKLFSWIRHFVAGRKQRVGVAGSLAAWAAFSVASHRDLCWGLYFSFASLMICQKTIMSLIFMYADDTNLF